MKVKFKKSNEFKGKKNWLISFTPSIGVSWENYGYNKVFMLFLNFLCFTFWIELHIKPNGNKKFTDGGLVHHKTNFGPINPPKNLK